MRCSEARGDGPFVLTKYGIFDIIIMVMQMARTAREKSERGIYHIMLRGIDRQLIFLDDEDNSHFVEVLSQCREMSGFRLFAYCLMGNHVHMLLQTEREPIDLVMKRIGTRYSVWFNSKYGRVGHLFQDRYKSEAIHDDSYYLTALRYILNNPVKAGICARAEEYPYSSAREYYTGERTGMTDTAFAETITGGHDTLMEFLTAPNEDVCMDDTRGRITDREAMELLRKTVGKKDLAVCKRAAVKDPDKFIPMLREAGLSIRQISRTTGLTVGIVRKY